MQRQNETEASTLGKVANAQKRHMVRDRVAGFALALALAVGFVTLNSAAAALAEPVAPAPSAAEPMPFGK